MKLSIITINYNDKEGLKKTFNSVQSQTFTDYEWIVIDGGSSDGSKEFIEQNKASFAYWVSESDKGIYNAMNKGISYANGEYVQFLNSGDFLINEKVLEKVFSNHHTADVLYGDTWFLNGSEIIEKRSYPQKINLSFLFRSPMGHQATFTRLEKVKKHLYKEQYTISGDRAFFLELYCNGCKFEYLGQPIVYFDSTGIGSRPETINKRKEQLYNIKREFFDDQVVCDIERWLIYEEEFSFVKRIKPLYLCYIFFKWLQNVKNKFR